MFFLFRIYLTGYKCADPTQTQVPCNTGTYQDNTGSESCKDVG